MKKFGWCSKFNIALHTCQHIHRYILEHMRQERETANKYRLIAR